MNYKNYFIVFYVVNVKLSNLKHNNCKYRSKASDLVRQQSSRSIVGLAINDKKTTDVNAHASLLNPMLDKSHVKEKLDSSVYVMDETVLANKSNEFGDQHSVINKNINVLYKETESNHNNFLMPFNEQTTTPIDIDAKIKTPHFCNNSNAMPAFDSERAVLSINIDTQYLEEPTKSTNYREPSFGKMFKDFDSCFGMNTNSKKGIYFLLLDALKNIFYYRSNIARYFSCLNSFIYEKRKKKLNVSQDIRKKLFAEFKTIAFEFITNKEPEVECKGISSCPSKLEQLLKDEKELINNFVSADSMAAISSTNAFKNVRSYNVKIVENFRYELHYTKYNNLKTFTKRHLAHQISPIVYYDMFVHVLKSLLRLSEYFDEADKKPIIRYLVAPPINNTNYYSDYKTIPKLAVFYWCLDWLYYFSNFHSLPCNVANIAVSIQIIDCYPKDFFIQVLTLFYFARNSEMYNYNINDAFYRIFIVRLEETIFYYADRAKHSCYQSTLLSFFNSITEIKSHMETLSTPKTHIKKLRTTEENIKFSNKLVPFVSCLLNYSCYLVLKSYELVKNDN